MKAPYTTFLLTVLLVNVLPATMVLTAGEQLDQRAIARQLLGENKEERSRALKAAQTVGSTNASQELRAALITLLEREDRIVAEAERRGVTVDTLEDPEFIAYVSRVVAELKDPKAIPALAGALGMGTVIAPLADFGQQAVPAVLGVVTAQQSSHYAVEDGLRTLRLIIERGGIRSLPVSMLDQIRRAVQQRLTGKQYFATIWYAIWYAIDLAASLNDPNLRRLVQSLASNRNEVFARGITDPELIEKTQKRAADRLAGTPR
jgi:hypothetical protein